MITIQQLSSIVDLKKQNFQTGFFQSVAYQEIFIQHFSQAEDVFILGIYYENQIIGYGIFEKQENTIMFSGMKKVLGSQELTDYGDIFLNSNFKDRNQEVWSAIIKWFQKKQISNIQLDYVKEDSSTYAIFKDKAQEQEVAPYIMLPITWEEYLEKMERKDRKELKRKLKRIETTDYKYSFFQVINRQIFDEFIRLHRLSNNNKKDFMSTQMENFFWDLANVKDKNWKAVINILEIENKSSATILTFENNSSIFAYNSGYDQSFNYYSAGLLIHALTIQRAIRERKIVYDFLRGNERYKYDLGGQLSKLYQIKIDL